jgi:hypothetical protein
MGILMILGNSLRNYSLSENDFLSESNFLSENDSLIENYFLRENDSQSENIVE